MMLLLLWVYSTTKNWQVAFSVAGKLEWPVKDKELINKLSMQQIILWKISAFLKLFMIVSLVTVLVVKIILLFRF